MLAEPDGQLTNTTPASGSFGTAINNAGQLVGYTESLQAFRWNAVDGVELLGPLGSYTFTFAYDINNAGQIVGEAKTITGDSARPFIFSDSTGMQEIPGFGGQSQEARGINSQGHVVGFSDAPIGLVGWIWRPGAGTALLSDVADPAANLIMWVASDINDAGQIVGWGHDRAVLLTPVGGSTTGDLDGSGGVDAADLALLLGAWGPCPPQADCTADLNTDGLVDAADLALLLGNWG